MQQALVPLLMAFHHHHLVNLLLNLDNLGLNMSSVMPIRSYVIRSGRFSNGQRRAYETLFSDYGIPFLKELINLNTIFGRDGPKILEIGSGMGETTAAIARQSPQNDYLAIEVHTPGIGSLLKLIDQHDLTNLRIIQYDAVEVLNLMIAEESLDGVHIFFPDPWPKKRHHKRRLIRPEFVALLCSRIKSGGYVHIATDWQAYAEQILEILTNELSLVNNNKDYASRPQNRPLTKFEQRGIQLGHKVWDLIFLKK